MRISNIRQDGGYRDDIATLKDIEGIRPFFDLRSFIGSYPSTITQKPQYNGLDYNIQFEDVDETDVNDFLNFCDDVVDVQFGSIRMKDINSNDDIYLYYSRQTATQLIFTSSIYEVAITVTQYGTLIQYYTLTQSGYPSDIHIISCSIPSESAEQTIAFDDTFLTDSRPKGPLLSYYFYDTSNSYNNITSSVETTGAYVGTANNQNNGTFTVIVPPNTGGKLIVSYLAHGVFDTMTVSPSGGVIK